MKELLRAFTLLAGALVLLAGGLAAGAALVHQWPGRCPVRLLTQPQPCGCCKCGANGGKCACPR